MARTATRGTEASYERNSITSNVGRLGERELPVRWAWYRPEPQVGDTVRLPTAPNGNDGWQSFRIVGKHLSEVVPTIEPTFTMIHLDVEPIALQD